MIIISRLECKITAYSQKHFVYPLNSLGYTVLKNANPVRQIWSHLGTFSLGGRYGPCTYTHLSELVFA